MILAASYTTWWDTIWQEIPAAPRNAFLPNSFVRVEVGKSPLARIINAGESDPLALAIRLYERQNMLEHRGVPIEDLRQFYTAQRQRIDGYPYQVAALAPGRLWEESSFSMAGISQRFGLDNERFWPALDILEDCHAVEWAVYSANGRPQGKCETARLARPVAVVRNGVVQPRAPEAKLGLLAYMIRLSMLARSRMPRRSCANGARAAPFWPSSTPACRTSRAWAFSNGILGGFAVSNINVDQR